MNTTDSHATETDSRFHIPALFGDDFAYTNATHNFHFINKLADLLSKHSLERYGVQMNIRYSTVDEYLHSLSKEAEYPVYQGDFFPYLQEVECEKNDFTCWRGVRIDHWTGYYSTRTVLKERIRELLSLVRSSEKLYSVFKYHQNMLLSSQLHA